MSVGAVRWAGAGLAAIVIVGLAVYFYRVGWDEADKRASVIGVLIAVAGFALAGLGPPHRRSPDESPGSEGVSNEISGGTFHGSVFQGRDFGPVNLNDPVEGNRGSTQPPADGRSTDAVVAPEDRDSP